MSSWGHTQSSSRRAGFSSFNLKYLLLFSVTVSSTEFWSVFGSSRYVDTFVAITRSVPVLTSNTNILYHCSKHEFQYGIIAWPNENMSHIVMYCNYQIVCVLTNIFLLCMIHCNKNHACWISTVNSHGALKIIIWNITLNLTHPPWLAII